MNVKHFSEEDKADFIRTYPKAQPQDWAVVDSGEDGVIGFYASEEEANKGLEEFQLDETIHDLFREWVLLTAQQLDVDLARVRIAVREVV